MNLKGRKPIFGWGINDADYVVSWRPDPKIRNKQVMCPFYKRWSGMLYRALGPQTHASVHSYNETTIGDGFKYFMEFRSWASNQGFSDVNKGVVELDKDILVMGNNHYSPDNCAFVTKKINMLLLTSNGSRGELPLGVTLCSSTVARKYVAGQTMYGKRNTLGRFDCELEAHKCWQLSKAAYIEEAISNYEQESEEVGLVFRPDIVTALLGRSTLLRNAAESGIVIDSL